MIMAISTKSAWILNPLSRSFLDARGIENLLDSFLQNDFIYFSVKLGAFAGNEYISHQI